MKISIASGKGGTGKTLVATSLALSLAPKNPHDPRVTREDENGSDRGAIFIPKVVIADCDVEEPNVHLFFPKKQLLEKKECTVTVPIINEKKTLMTPPKRMKMAPRSEPFSYQCNHCGLCSQTCAFHALAVLPDQVLIFPELCHGCGGCALVCPEKAISEGSRSVGRIFRARSDGLDIIWGELRLGEARTTPLIRGVKELAKNDLVIVDCPPGTSCTMVESVRDTDFCLLVTEPTPFGLYDLDIALRVLEKMRIPSGVLVNKSGMGDKKVYEYLEKQNIPLLMEIPFSRQIAELYSRGIIFVEQMPEWKGLFRDMAQKIEEAVS